MPRQVNHEDLSPLGAALLRGAAAKGLNLSEVNELLGWPQRRIYDVIRAGNVRASWVGELAVILDLDIRALIALDARKA